MGADPVQAGRPTTAGHPGLLLLPGANNEAGHPLLVELARAMASRDWLTRRQPFSFRGPDRPRGTPSRDGSRELADARRALETMRSFPRIDPRRLFIAGKSLGARIATQLAAAEPEGPAGVVILGYSLHGPGGGRPHDLSHWPRVRQPVLFLTGDRDPFCHLDRLAGALRHLPRAELRVIEGADHGFAPRTGSGIPKGELVRRAVAEAVAWLEAQAGAGDGGATGAGR